MPLLPSAITLRNYRSFVEPVRLELRPVTLLFGINNAGKSALLRALPLLGDSLETQAWGPLNLESLALRGSSFHDLRWKGPIEEDRDPDLGIAFHWQQGESSSDFELALQWRDEWKRLAVRRLTLREGTTEPVEAELRIQKGVGSANQLPYELRTAEGLSTCSIGFRGLLPEATEPEIDELLAAWRDRISGLRDRVQWLASTRRLPETRPMAYPSGPRWRLRPDGEDVGAVLATQPVLLEEVSSWYRQHLRRRLVVRDAPPGSYRLVLEAGGFDVDLMDTGEGMIQVLAVLTALAASRLEGGPSILAIEEPESHLHPELQRALAERVCDLSRSAANRPRVVLETHSELFVLAVQLQIVLDVLKPEDVIVYWIRQLENGESVADPIVFDRDAQPVGNSLPPGVFSQDTDLAREIIRARAKRSRS